MGAGNRIGFGSVGAAILLAILLASLACGCSASETEQLGTVKQAALPIPTRVKVGIRAKTISMKGGYPNLNVWHEFDVKINDVRTARAGYLFECGGVGSGTFGGTSGHCPFHDLPPVTYNYPNAMGFCTSPCVPGIAASIANTYKSLIISNPPAVIPINVTIPLLGQSFNFNNTITFDLSVDAATGAVTPEPQNTWHPDIVELTDTCVKVDWIPPDEWTLCWDVEWEALSTPTPTVPFTPPPGGARRLSAAQYRRTVTQLLGPEAGAVAEPPPDAIIPVASLYAFDRNVDYVEAWLLESTAIAVAAQSVQTPARLAQQAPCVTQGPTDPDFRRFCYEQVAQRIGHLAWRLPPADDVKGRLIDVALVGEAEGTTDSEKLAAGLKYLIATILESPSFLHSIEIGTPSGVPGKRDLTAFEMATRLALFLTGRGPSESLLELAAAGALDTPQGITAVAAQILATPEARDGFNDQLEEIFQLKLFPTKGKDPNTFPEYTPTLVAAMREEVQRFAQNIVFDNPRSFLNVLTETGRFVNTELAQSVYAIPPPATEWGFVDFAPLGQKRAGLMTMPAMLTILSHPVQSSITRRGLFAQDYLYCQQAPPPPGVDITIDPQPGQTLRQFMEAHGLQPRCVGCHTVMDPIAFAFENFDAIGRFRVNEVPGGTGTAVDTTATNVRLFDGALFGDGAYADAVEWASEAVSPTMRPKLSRCWVDQIYRNAVGASAGPDQDALLAAIDTSFAGPASDQYLLLTLLSELVSSPAFGQVGEPR